MARYQCCEKKLWSVTRRIFTRWSLPRIRALFCYVDFRCLAANRFIPCECRDRHQSKGLVNQSVGDTKSLYLQDGLILRGPEAKRLYATSLLHPMRGCCASFRSGSRLIKLDDETVLRSLPTEDIRAGGERDVGNCDG